MFNEMNKNASFSIFGLEMFLLFLGMFIGWFFGFNPLMVQQKSFNGVKGSLMEEKLITCLAI